MQSALSTARAALYEPSIAEFGKHVARATDGTFALDVKSAQQAGIDPVVFADLQRSLDTTNRLIRRGELKADQVFAP